MKKKRKNVIVITLVSLVLLICIAVYLALPYVKPINSGVIWTDNEVSEEEQNLLNFVTTNLMNDDYGILTNYKNEKSEGEITKGHSVLSESEGLMLLYYLSRDDKGNYNKILSYIKDNMIMDNGLLRWRVGEDANDVPAAIDDLRVIKALLLASEKWDEISYRKDAFKISKGLKKNLIDGNLLSDFYDDFGKSSKTQICYLDILSLRLLASLDNDYKKIYNASLEILDKSLISEEVPLYRKEYDRSTGEFDKGNLDMELNSIVLLNRAEAGLKVDNSIRFLKNKYSEDNGIFSMYDDSGKVLSNIESTTIYSNLLQTAVLAGDYELYDICKKKIIAYQVKDKNSEIFGAYGDTETLQVHSFNNLNALLAWRKIKK